jgi:hypothetical protein
MERVYSEIDMWLGLGSKKLSLWSVKCAESSHIRENDMKIDIKKYCARIYPKVPGLNHHCTMQLLLLLDIAPPK